MHIISSLEYGHVAEGKASKRVWPSDRRSAAAVVAAILSACATVSLADNPAEWPTQSLRLVVGYPPGSSPDRLARLVADPLGRLLGKPIVIENKPGAAGNLGVDAVVKSLDGHTFGVTTFGPLTTSKLLFKKLPYEPARDVLPIALLATSPLVLVCDIKLPPNSLKEFVAWAKGQAHGVTYGSIGIGSGSHLTMELFASRTGIPLVHVPYHDIPQVTTAILSHQVQAAFMPPSGALAQAKAGNLRMLAVSSAQRWPLIPELPTVSEEMVIGDFRAEVWVAAFGSVAMPPQAAARLSAEINAILKQPDIREKLRQEGWEVVGGGPDELRLRMSNDTALWTRVIQEAQVPSE